jgi:hypothetical protein
MADEEEPASVAQANGTASESQEGSGQEDGGSSKKAVVGRRKDGRNYVQKNSLVESDLVEAREEARSNLKRKNTEELTEDDRKDDRRAANRLSAFQSRQRRKLIIEDLQKTVAEQSKHNADQSKEMAELKRALATALQENEMMRRQLTGQGVYPGGAMFGGTPGQMPHSLPLFAQSLQQQQQLQNVMIQNALLLSQQSQARGGAQPNAATNQPAATDGNTTTEAAPAEENAGEGETTPAPAGTEAGADKEEEVPPPPAGEITPV